MRLLPFYMLTFAAGVSVTVQQVLNANLRGQIGSPWWAGVTSYVVGLLVMLAVAIPIDGVRGLRSMISHVEGFTWIGGALGAFFIATAILMVPRLGATTTLGFVIVGQLVAAAAIDHFGLLGIAQSSLTPLRIAGIAMLVGGMVLVRT
jgi:bacterial/archaeal transporter family-2 protein